MPLESANTLSALQEIWPLGSDGKDQGDDHIRLIKAVLKNQFPGAGGQGFSTPINATEQNINFLVNLSVNVQDALTALGSTKLNYPVSPTADAPYSLRNNVWNESGYRIKELATNAAATSAYNSMDYILITFAGPVTLTASAWANPGKVITFEKANALQPVSFANGSGSFYSPNLDPITEEGRVFCLVCTGVNQWRVIR